MSQTKTARAAPLSLAIARDPDIVCRDIDPLFLAIKRCLDSRAGTCFVVDKHRRLLGRITLDSARSAMRMGELWAHTTLGNSRALLREPVDARVEVAMPVLDSTGRLVDVVLDRGRVAMPLARPDLSSCELEALLDAFLSTWISGRGPYVSALEQRFAAFIGSGHALAVSSGTAALHLALLALGIGPGDEVVVPDLTFAATINAVLHCGATPVIADIDAANWGLCPDALEHAITPRTRAVILVHLYGRPVLSETIARARKHRLAIVEDCAEAQGARLFGRRVGGIGDVGCFSLFANKLISTGEGGMCVTSSEEHLVAMRKLRDHGTSPEEPLWHDEVGYNYRMTNLQAAIGTAQIERFEEILSNRNCVANLYRELLTGIPGVGFPVRDEPESTSVSWLVTVTVPADKRTALIEAAARERIELRAFFHPLSSMPPYREFARECPKSVAVSRSGLCLPTTGSEDAPAVEKIAQVFRAILC